jgi:acetyl esterase/lipase
MNPARAALVFAVLIARLEASGVEPLQVIPLWPNGAPGSEARRNEPEQAADYWVRNIHNPSVAVYLPPKEKATGAAVVICPGGGHRLLVYIPEGVEPARYLNNLGVAAFVLKYRLAREAGSSYTIEKDVRADGQRAVRLVRSRAAEWNVDPRRIGIMGWSAGGEVVAQVVYSPTDGNPHADDPVERVSCRPDFQILIYPGAFGVPDVVPVDAPPVFFLAANDDEAVPNRTYSSLLVKYQTAGIPIEFHLYAHGRHAFNMGNRSKLVSIQTWPQRMADWLLDSGILHPASAPAAVAKP